MKGAGYEITTTRWLNDYDAEYDRTGHIYHDMVEEKVAGLTNPMQIIPLAHRYVYRVCPPRQGLDKKFQRLAVFTKTPELAAGESYNVTLHTDVRAFASYDEKGARLDTGAGGLSAAGRQKQPGFQTGRDSASG